MSSRVVETQGGRFGTGGRYFDRQSVLSSVNEQQENLLFKNMGLGRVEVPLGSNQGVSIQTLADRFDGPAPVILQTLKLATETFDDSWHAAIAPMSSTGELTEKVNTTFYKSYALEQQPEMTVPRTIQREYDQVVFHAQRYGGKADFSHDWFMTPEGERDFQRCGVVLVSATWRSAKIVVEQALEAAKNVWLSRPRNNEIGHADPLSATAIEREMFACVSYNPDKALDLVHNNVRNLARTEDVEFDSAVFPEGTLSLVGAAPYRTENSRTGGGELERLQSGAQSVRLPGVTIYQHYPQSLANDPQNVHDHLVSISQVGRFFTMYTDSGSLCAMDECDARKAKSIMIPDATARNYWRLITEVEAKAHSGRYNVDGHGRLSRTHDFLIQNVRTLLEEAGIQLTDGYLDPYVEATEATFTGLDTNPENQGFKVIEHYGDAPLQAWPVKQAADMGVACKNRMLSRKNISDSDISAIERMRRIGEQLNTYNPEERAVRDFFAAVALNPENAPSGGLLKANLYGGVMPPFVAADNSLSVNTATGPQAVTTDGAGAYELGRQAGAAGGSKTPFGFGGITGLRTLAAMYRAGQYRGYDVNMLRDISDGVQALDVIVSWLDNMFPNTLFSNPHNVPVYLRTGDEESDRRNAIVASLLQLQPHPVMVAAPNGNALGGGAVANDRIAPDAAFATFTTDAETQANMRAAIAAYARRTDASPKVIAVFANAQSIQRFADAYKKGFGKMYARFTAKSRTAAAADNEFIIFFVEQISDTAAIDDAGARLFTSVVSTVLSGQSAVREVNDAYFNSLRQGTEAVLTKKRARTAVTRTEAATGYVNSRLVISDGIWGALGKRNADITAADLYPILPADPNNSLLPLGTASAAEGGVDVGAELSTFARAPRSGLFGTRGMFQATRGGGGGGRGMSARDRASRENLDISAAESGSIFSSEFTDAFVSTVGYEDRYGRPNDTLYEQTQKKNLASRINGLLKSDLDPVSRMCALLYVLADVHWDNVVNASEAGLPIFGSTLLIACPWMRFRLASGLWFRSGSAKTNIKYEDTSLQMNIENKRWTLHHTVHLGCTIYDPTGYVFVPSLDFRRLISGLDSSFIECDREDFDVNNINFETAGSLFVFDIGNSNPADLPNPITLSGRHHRESYPNIKFSNPDQHFASTGLPVYPSAAFENARCGFHRIRRHGPDMSSFVSARMSDWVNEVIFVGRQRNYDPKTGSHSTMITGTSHVCKFDPESYGTVFYGGARLAPQAVMKVQAV